MENLMSLTIILLAIIFFAFIFIYLMYVRMKQLETELFELKSRISITDDELTRLSKDIEDFKKINI
jgi:cell division protein FtsL